MSGYASEIHFIRQFKQQTGQTPSQYREHKIKPDRL
ncbi:AraC family transcriptional regulator [Paenibacillus sp. XY044]